MKKDKTVIEAADLFCGAGGTSTGIKMAAQRLGLDVRLLAVNHWQVAIATHSANHEESAHLCQAVGSVDPLQAVPSGRLKLLVASPECTHHSNARGGKPRNDQKRADAWELFHWLTELYVENVLIENVREFRDWGPLGANGKPLKSRRGEYYRQFRSWLEVTYHVEEKILNAADYGDATTRERLFLLCRRPQHKAIVWPEPTHASLQEIEKAARQPRLFGSTRKLKPWRAAREIIDWEQPSHSIFLSKEDARPLKIKRPLSHNTLARIFAGLQKYSSLPFVLPHQHGSSGNGNVRDIEKPLPTITGTSSDMFVAEPFIVNLKGENRGDRSVEEPTFAQTAIPHQCLIEPFICNMEHSTGEGGGHGRFCYPLERPLPTVAGKGMFGLIEPFLVRHFGERDGQEPRTRHVDQPLWTVTGQRTPGLVSGYIVKSYKGSDAASLDEPLPTVTANFEHLALAEPFLTAFHGSHKGRKDGDKRTRSVDEPLPTADASNRFGLALPFIVPVNHGNGDKRTHSIDEPMPSITSVDAWGVAEPYLVKFYGNGGAQSIDEPLATVTSKDRFALITPQFALVIPQLGVMLDIRFRMLQPHELAAAMSFPKSYHFTGTREDKVKQIGNAVPVRLAEALCRSLLKPEKKERRRRKVA